MATDLALGDPAGSAGSPPTASLTFDQPDGSGDLFGGVSFTVVGWQRLLERADRIGTRRL
jgi:hypothetical protein